MFQIMYFIKGNHLLKLKPCHFYGLVSQGGAGAGARGQLLCASLFLAAPVPGLLIVEKHCSWIHRWQDTPSVNHLFILFPFMHLSSNLSSSIFSLSILNTMFFRISNAFFGFRFQKIENVYMQRQYSFLPLPPQLVLLARDKLLVSCVFFRDTSCTHTPKPDVYAYCFQDQNTLHVALCLAFSINVLKFLEQQSTRSFLL